MTNLTVAERVEVGRSQRKAVPRSVHGEWVPAPDRPDPVALLEEQDKDRVPWLVPIRHARMQVSPFTFYRGAARIMSADLAQTPSSGLDVQLGGDAHLSNFGAYASPERQLVFDQNDFDETLPGPWEWDLKRLAASVMVAGQHLGFSPADCQRATSEASRSYRAAIGQFADMGHLDLWYEYVSVDRVRSSSGLGQKELEERVKRFRRRATHKTSQQALEKLAETTDKGWRIRNDPPVLFRLSSLPTESNPAELEAAATGAFEAYKDTLDDNRRHLIERYEIVDIGVKVVGVGSVGTRCLLLLLRGRDDHDPLFLQAKEAGRSVMEGYLPPSRYDNHGQRVVEGQRLSQAQSDILLGWTEGLGPDRRHFYIRQLRDWKGSVEIDADATPNQSMFYAGLCALTLARGHARSGDAEAIRAYVGQGKSLDRSITAFAEAYADQNLEDFKAFRQAIEDGRLECSELV